MEKRKIALFLLSALMVTASYAKPQHVQVCLKVKNNTSNHTFLAGFVSSDFFDRGNYSHSITNGEICVKHTYGHGPKNLKFRVMKEHGAHESVLITPDESCSFMKNQTTDLLNSDFQATGSPNQFWSFKIKQMPPVDGFAYTYKLHCEHKAS